MLTDVTEHHEVRKDRIEVISHIWSAYQMLLENTNESDFKLVIKHIEDEAIR